MLGLRRKRGEGLTIGTVPLAVLTIEDDGALLSIDGRRKWVRYNESFLVTLPDDESASVLVSRHSPGILDIGIAASPQVAIVRNELKTRRD